MQENVLRRQQECGEKKRNPKLPKRSKEICLEKDAAGRFHVTGASWELH